MVDESTEFSAMNSRRFIKNSYANLLLYYRETGIGKKSQITGAVITELLINAIERRYKQLGGNTALLYLRASMPMPNGQLKKKEQRDERK